MKKTKKLSSPKNGEGQKRKSSKQEMGRPTIYSEKLVDEICEKISTTHYGITRLCKHNPHWPNQETIYRWIGIYPYFSKKYIEAKQMQAEILVDTVLHRAFHEEEDGVNDLIKINQRRVEADFIKWVACKLRPKIYGTRVENDVTVRTHDNDVNDEWKEKRSKLIKGCHD